MRLSPRHSSASSVVRFSRQPLRSGLVCSFSSFWLRGVTLPRNPIQCRPVQCLSATALVGMGRARATSMKRSCKP
eukprot:3839005-Prymnesium_polylepis.1